MADHAVEHIRIAAPPERCFEIAADFDRYPQWATDLKEVEVEATDGEGRGTRVRFTVAALGRRVGYVLDYDYAGAPQSFSWTLHRSDMVRVLDGSYRFEPDGTGTALTYTLAIDLAVPLPGFVKRKAAGMIVQNAVKGFKRYAESGA